MILLLPPLNIRANVSLFFTAAYKHCCPGLIYQQLLCSQLPSFWSRLLVFNSYTSVMWLSPSFFYNSSILSALDLNFTYPLWNQLETWSNQCLLDLFAVPLLNYLFFQLLFISPASASILQVSVFKTNFSRLHFSLTFKINLMQRNPV